MCSDVSKEMSRLVSPCLDHDFLASIVPTELIHTLHQVFPDSGAMPRSSTKLRKGVPILLKGCKSLVKWGRDDDCFTSDLGSGVPISLLHRDTIKTY